MADGNLNVLELKIEDFLKMELDALVVADDFLQLLKKQVRARRIITERDVEATRRLRKLIDLFTLILKQNM